MTPILFAALALQAGSAPAPTQPPPLPPAPTAQAPVASAPPADAARMAAAEELVAVLNLGAQYDRSFALLIPVMTSQIFDSIKDNVTVPVALRKHLADPDNLSAAKAMFGREVIAGFRKRYPEFIRRTAAEYAREFTAAELRELRAFYGTPLGQKTLTALPELQRRLFNMGGAAGQDVGREAMIRTVQAILQPKRPTT